MTFIGMQPSKWLSVAIGVSLSVLAVDARADMIADSVNIADNGDSGAYWGSTDVGWLYTPSTSYALSGVETKFSIPNGTSIQDRTVTVVLYQGNTPSNGGTLLGSFNFNSALADNNTLGGGDFATPISLTAGTQYFVGFENTGPIPLNSPPNENDIGVNFTADAGATFLSNLYYDSDNSATFSNEDTNTDILGQPILAFLSPIPILPPPVPEPASLTLLGSALLGFGAIRRRRKAT